MNCIPSAAEIVRRPPWIAAHCLQTLLSLATLLLSFKFVIVFRHSSLLNDSTVMLVSLLTVFANLHAFFLIGVQVYDLVNSILYTDSCKLSLKTSDCAIPNFIIMLCIVGMVICQNALWIDRFAATIFAKFHRQHCKQFGFVLCFAVTSMAFLVPFLILRHDPYNDLVLTCMMTPAGSATEINHLFYSFIVLNLLSVAANIFLHLINRRKEKRLRFNVTKRFQAFENALVTKWVGMVVWVQFVFMTAYSLAMFLIRSHGENLPEPTKLVLRIWFYLVPFSTVSLPLISLFALRLCTTTRIASITRMTSQKADHSTYMNHLMEMWS